MEAGKTEEGSVFASHSWALPCDFQHNRDFGMCPAMSESLIVIDFIDFFKKPKDFAFFTDSIISSNTTTLDLESGITYAKENLYWTELKWAAVIDYLWNKSLLT